MRLVLRHHCLPLIILALFYNGTNLQLHAQSKKPIVFDSLDQFDIKNGSYLLPQSLPKGKYHHAFSILYVMVPQDWAHDIVNAPMFNYSAKYTLPSGFNVQANLATLFISSRVNAGPFWNYSFDKYHVGIGYQVAFNFGILKQFGFNTILTIWEQQPSLTLGYSFEKSAVTVRGDVYFTNSFRLSEGSNVISFTGGGLNGYSVTTSLEQRLWKDRVISFGVKINYVRYHILAWPTFPVNSYRYYVPEFQVGLKFK